MQLGGAPELDGEDDLKRDITQSSLQRAAVLLVRSSGWNWCDD